jgi:hypothetical protein
MIFDHIDYLSNVHRGSLYETIIIHLKNKYTTARVIAFMNLNVNDPKLNEWIGNWHYLG